MSFYTLLAKYITYENGMSDIDEKRSLFDGKLGFERSLSEDKKYISFKPQNGYDVDEMTQLISNFTASDNLVRFKLRTWIKINYKLWK